MFYKPVEYFDSFYMFFSVFTCIMNDVGPTTVSSEKIFGINYDKKVGIVQLV